MHMTTIIIKCQK